MSLKIDEYSGYYETVSQTTAQKAIAKTQAEDESEKKRDSYISSIGNAEEISPCENYNNILLKVFQQSNADSSQSYSSADKSEESQTGSGTAESTDSGSENEDETKTEIVTINGVTYLETTTVTNGVTNVQRTVLNGQENKQGKAE